MRGLAMAMGLKAVAGAPPRHPHRKSRENVEASGRLGARRAGQRERAAAPKAEVFRPSAATQSNGG